MMTEDGLQLVKRGLDRLGIEVTPQRIVACVNACEGINSEAVPELLKACENAAGLLGRLQGIVGETDFDEVQDAAGVCDDAIAKAKGE